MAEYVWDFQLLDGSERISEDVVREIHGIFENGFGILGWSPDGVKKRLKHSTILGLLKGPDMQIHGYAIYSVPDERLEGTYLLWEDGICIEKELQRKGYASQNIFKQTCSFFPDRKFGWIGGRTQNPIVFHRYARLGTTYPFDKTYEAPGGQRVMDFLRENIAEVGGVEELNPQYGLCQQIYGEGRLGDYRIDIDGAERFEDKLGEWGFKRDEGDAVVVMVKLERPILATATPREKKVYVLSEDLSILVPRVFKYWEKKEEEKEIGDIPRQRPDVQFPPPAGLSEFDKIMKYLEKRFQLNLKFDQPWEIGPDGHHANEYYNTIAKYLGALINKLGFDGETGETIVELRTHEFFDPILRYAPLAHLSNEFWINVDRVYAKKQKNGFQIDICRYVDMDKNNLGRGGRPNTPPFKEQLQNCKTAWKDRGGNEREMRAVLIDDGSFDGDTALQLADCLAQEGMSVKTLRLAMSRGEAWEKLIAGGKYNKFELIICYGTSPNLLDWICETFPGHPRWRENCRKGDA